MVQRTFETVQGIAVYVLVGANQEYKATRDRSLRFDRITDTLTWLSLFSHVTPSAPSRTDPPPEAFSRRLPLATALSHAVRYTTWQPCDALVPPGSQTRDGRTMSPPATPSRRGQHDHLVSTTRKVRARRDAHRDHRPRGAGSAICWPRQ